jgi:hypothetical protein
MTTTAIQTITPEFIESQLQRFDDTTESLITLVQPFKGLSIIDVNDREGYVKVREARLQLKTKRVEIEKSGKELRDNAVRFQKAVITREKELIAILEPEEIRLKEEEKRFEEEKERLRMEQERKETERVQNRINALAKFNFAIDFYECKIMSEEDYYTLLKTAEEEFNKEQERIAAEKAEQERLRNEKNWSA